MKRLAAVLALLLAPLLAQAQANEVPLPKLPRGVIDMRVAYVINRRLPRMDARQVRALLASAAATAREHFGVRLRFGEVHELDIAEVFSRIPGERRQMAMDGTYDFKSGKADPSPLAASFARSLRESGDPVAQLAAFAQPYVGKTRLDSYEALGEALSALQLQRIRQWQQLRGMDGGPVIDDKPYNEFPMWLALGYTDLPYELVLTNEPIASVEYGYAAVHSAIRGGYSNGLTTYGRSARFLAMSVWSTFAFTSKDPWVLEMRGGETYGRKEAARLAGMAAAHELGHQLFHFQHPFSNSACVMRPVPLFAYRAWAQGLSAKLCPIGGDPAMRPGAVRLNY